MKPVPLMSSCKKRIAAVWLAFGGGIFLVLLAQSFFDTYEGQANDAWGWFLPSVMPTLSLIISVIVFDSRSGQTEKTADRFMYVVAIWLSVFYLLTVFSTILVQPLTTLLPLELMRQSNLWLGPLQGLVAAALGAFFVKQEDPDQAGAIPR